ncbi:Nucleotidyl transferase [Chloroherpeton thalassium ATCC 35110]|uniref:Nucleotidyl transferase n=1 Tax=Chloroherpeton thalassium (strain ATCC 35110 / GB-78) TaxID=517418 RepID=B3QY55_CHLT3|nr:sugar phosphate nucleotidyltransferase [Chloroherpeton thalassium]ACF15021.1 Nucleotidyl transferase [Chloroherpeton thalassium ATCC 35110]
MKAIIPVAGVGSRLRPHTYTLPKVLLNVAGKPIIGHIIDKIIEEGINEAVVVVGYLGDMIQEYLTKNYDIKFTFVEQEERLGLAHAIWMCKAHINQEEPVFIILGDTIFEVELTDVFKREHSSLGVKMVEDPRRFGVAVLEDGFVSEMVEKPETPISNLALVGLYYVKNSKLLFDCLQYEIDNDIRTKGEYQLTDALQLMIERGEQFSTFPVEGWYDCGKPETLLSTNEVLLKSKSHPHQIYNCVVNPPVYIAESAKVENSVIGPFATIANNAVVKDSIIKNSIIGEGAEVKGLLLDESIIGNNARANGNFRRMNIGDSSEIDFR